MITVSTFNIKLGLLLTDQRLNNLFDHLHTDVLALQEVPEKKLTRILNHAEEHDYHFSYYSSVDKTLKFGHQGNLILSKFPLKRMEEIDISFKKRQKRLIQKVAVESPQGKLNFINTHFGLGRKEKKYQFLRLREIIKAIKHQPSVFVGDFNDWNYKIMKLLEADVRGVVTRQSKIKTFPALFPVLSLDNIYYNHFLELSLLKTNTLFFKKCSDHLPLMAKFKLLQH